VNEHHRYPPEGAFHGAGSFAYVADAYLPPSPLTLAAAVVAANLNISQFTLYAARAQEGISAASGGVISYLFQP